MKGLKHERKKICAGRGKSQTGGENKRERERSNTGKENIVWQVKEDNRNKLQMRRVKRQKNVKECKRERSDIGKEKKTVWMAKKATEKKKCK